MLKREAQSVTNPLDPPLSFWEGAIPASPPIVSGMQPGHRPTCLCGTCTGLRLAKARSVVALAAVRPLWEPESDADTS